MSACPGVEEAGADPRRQNGEGCVALSYAAAEGLTGVVGLQVVDMLPAGAHETVSHVSLAGATPLHFTVCQCKEGGVDRLLAAEGAQQRRYRPALCPPKFAVVGGGEPILRALLRCLEAVGGAVAVRGALEAPVLKRRAAPAPAALGGRRRRTSKNKKKSCG